jgi:hypothetical protein
MIALIVFGGVGFACRAGRFACVVLETLLLSQSLLCIDVLLSAFGALVILAAPAALAQHATRLVGRYHVACFLPVSVTISPMEPLD